MACALGRADPGPVSAAANARAHASRTRGDPNGLLALDAFQLVVPGNRNRVAAVGYTGARLPEDVRAGYALSEAGKKRFKGIADPVAVVRLRRAET